MIRRIIDIPQGHFWRSSEPGNLKISVEETGYGNLLCMDGYGGRFFRSSEEAVREQVDKFVEDYIAACNRFDEDPAHEYFEVFNFNDLYSLLGLIPTHFGDQWGYSISEDSRTRLGFDINLVDDFSDSYFEKLQEPVLVIEPCPDSYPFDYYKEV